MAAGSTGVLSSAPPPAHAVAAVIAVCAVAIAFLPHSLEESLDDQAAKAETFSKVLFPNIFTLRTIGYLRLAVAVSVWLTTFHTVFLNKGWDQTTSYLSSSKLKRAPFRLVGWKTCFQFTHWSWIVLGASFSINAYITFRLLLLVEREDDDDTNNNEDPVVGGDGAAIPRWIFRAAILLWETAAPLSLLVSCVTTYVIWPAAIRNNNTTDLQHPRNIMMHNANVFFCAVEAALLSGLPIRWADAAVAPLFGMVYIAFTWCSCSWWASDFAKDGPQFLYFFLDTTLGLLTTKMLAALVLALLFFYALFVALTEVLLASQGSIYLHLGAVVIICRVFMRFRP